MKDITYKGHTINVWSENMFKSFCSTKNPRQMWTAVVDGVNTSEGHGSRKDAVSSAMRIIDRRIERASQVSL